MENLLVLVLTALFSSTITYWFGIRHIKTEIEINIKIEKYNNLIKYLRGFIGRTASGDLKQKFLQEWETSWLYCSDDVFHAIHKMIEYLQKSRKDDLEKQETGEHKILGEIILAMRKDLLRKKTKLSNRDFIFLDVIE